MQVWILLLVSFFAFADPSQAQTEQCGKSMTSGSSARIIGGKDADVGAWPWQAMILQPSIHNSPPGSFDQVCGGSLIGRQWILSAAECFNTKNPFETKIALGARFGDFSGNNTKILAVSRVLCHSDYNATTMENDICLVKLASEVEYTKYISPICLPSSSADNVIAGETCVITGWGDTMGTGGNWILQEAYVEVFSRLNCTNWYAENNTKIPEDDICAGTIDASKGTCYGDGGGPLACSRGRSFFTLYGITSDSAVSMGCLTPERPNVFTGVTNYLDWIEKTKENGVNVCFDLLSIHSCGNVITANNSRIRSPIANNMTWFYPDNMNCSWTVQAPTGYVVKIEFLCYFNFSGCDDYLKIETSSGRGARYCGILKSDELEPYVTEGSEVRLHFHSDGHTSSQGFVLKISFVSDDGSVSETATPTIVTSVSETATPTIVTSTSGADRMSFSSALGVIVTSIWARFL